MKTMNELKATFGGIVIMGTVILLVLTMADTLKYSEIDWSYLANNALAAAGFALLSMAITYIGWHLKNAIGSDIADFKEWRKEKRTKAATA